jgi:ligand-binding SRPBCC domain-containing protein
MPVITLETRISAAIERCFDLSRDVELHMRSTEQTREVAVAGIVTGLIGPGEEVTWQATHFGFRQRLTTKITAYDRPFYFRDSQVRGAFKRFDHDHYFQQSSTMETVMRDVFDYESPLGLLGRLADRLFLEKHMTSLLLRRNELIKRVAETVSAA